MAAANFTPCLDVVLAYEGKFSIDRRDPGNWTGGKVGKGELKGTNYGIAASAHPTLNIAHLTKDEAGAIYKSEYWDKVWGDSLPPGLDLSIFDPAVNSGVSRAKSWLKAARGASATTDGQITAVATSRLSFLHALATWKAFGKGWGTRVAGIEAKSHRMALGTSPTATATIAAKANAHKTASVAKKKAAQATAGGSTAAPAVAAGAGSGHHGLLIAFLVVGLVAAGVIAFVAWRQSQRATALSAEAAH